jgi:hypothetical protein
LDTLLQEPVEPPHELLYKYSYKKSACQLYELLTEYL